MADKIRSDAPDWDDLRTFLVLARHGRLSAAARALGVNHATVSRRTSSRRSRGGGAGPRVRVVADALAALVRACRQELA